MKRFCVAFGLSTALTASLAACSTMNGAAPDTAPADSYAAGKAHFAAGQLGLALTDFERALKEQGPSVDRLNALAATYDRLSRFDLADRAYRQALVIDPNAVQTLNNIGYSYLLRGRADLASAYLAKAQSMAKDDARIGANLALASDALEGSPMTPVSAPSRPEPAAPSAPVEIPHAAVTPTLEAARPAVTLLRPQHGTHIEPVAKGVFRLVTIEAEDDSGEEAAMAMPSAASEPAALAKPEPAPEMRSAAVQSPALAEPAFAPAILTATFEIPAVVEPMPAIMAVPVSAVQSEPLAALERLRPAAGPSPVAVPIPPATAGIIRVAASSTELPEAARPAAPETAPAIEADRARLSDALIEVSNGSGIERSGARFRAYLKEQGVPVRRLTNDARFGHAQTILFYKHGFLGAAQAIASELPMPIALEQNDRQRSDLRLRLGLDSKPFDNYLSAGIITASQ
jgi:hypothetical protein